MKTNLPINLTPQFAKEGQVDVEHIPPQDAQGDDCICTDYDGKGISPCGVPCPVHNSIQYNVELALEKLSKRHKHGAWLDSAFGDIRSTFTALITAEVAKAHEPVFTEGYKQGFNDCKKMVENGEHARCCIIPNKNKKGQS